MPIAPRAAYSRLAVPVESVPYERSAYAGTRPRGLLLLTMALHAAALFALIKLDVVHIGKAAPKPLAVTMVALEPPPPEHAPPKSVTPPDRTPPVVAPTPIVALAAPPVPTIAAAPPPPTVVAPPAPTPAPVAAPPGPPSPVVVADLMADLIAGDPPRFPTESRRLRESGTVRLRLVISPTGLVEDIAVVQSSGFDRLDRAAVAAVRKWRFRPGTRGGEAVGATGYLPITFAPPR